MGTIGDLSTLTSDISRSWSAYTTFASQIRSSGSAITQLTESLRRQRETDRKLLGTVASVLARLRVDASVTANFRDMSMANCSLAKLASNAAVIDSTLSKVFAQQSTLRASLDSVRAFASTSSLLSSIDTTRLLATSLGSQRRLFDMEGNAIGRLIEASALLTNQLTATFGKMTRSYRNVIECLPRVAEPMVPVIAKFSPIEYSLELDVLERISVDPEKDSDDRGLPSIDEELEHFDNRLMILVTGARKSLTCDNPDRARHVTTSVRELFTHIVHGLAPDDAVRKWSSHETDFHNKRPTRRARLLYICREFACKPLEKFVEDDVTAALTLVDSLHSGTHAIQSKLTDRQLEAIVHRMESLAVFLLKISRDG